MKALLYFLYHGRWPCSHTWEVHKEDLIEKVLIDKFSLRKKTKMETASAFLYGQIHRDSPPRVFDWVKAAQMIRDRLLVGNLKIASAGLRDDWEYTGGVIFQDGSPVPEHDTYTYLASTWAIPELFLDGDIFECWIWKKDSPGWDAGTYWPPEALAILENFLSNTEK